MAIQQMLLGIPAPSGGGVPNGLGSVDLSAGAGASGNNGSYLTIDGDDALLMGDGDFTIEAFALRLSSTTNDNIFTLGDSSQQNTIEMYFGGSGLTCYVNGTSRVTSASARAYGGQGNWEHHACVRKDNVMTFYFNGTSIGTYNSGNNFGSGSNGAGSPNSKLWIGQEYYSNNYYSTMNGKISNVRVVRGQAIYTSNFTPATEPLTTTSQGCQPYNVVFLGCNNASDAKIATVAVNPIVEHNGAVASEESPFSSSTADLSHTGGSVYCANLAHNNSPTEFDTEPLTVELSGGEMDFGAGAYTIEYFFKPDKIATTRSYSMIAARWDPTNRSFYTGVRDPDDLTYYYSFSVNNPRFDGGWVHNKWHHLAYCRDGSSTRVYLDGVLKQTLSDTNHDTGNSSANLTIGWQHDGGESFTNGTISNLRIVKGQALYTSNFTPSTSELTTTSQGASASNVVFLGCQSKYDPRYTVKNAGTRPKVKSELINAASGEAAMTGLQAIGSLDSPFATPVNNGTTWSSYLTCPSSSFDISVTKAFDGYRGTAQSGDAARTSANAPKCILDLSSVPITVNKTVHLQHCTSYEHWIEITVDGTNYTTTTMNGFHTFEVSGQLTRVEYENSNPNGRSYLEAVFIDGQLLVDGLVG